MRIFVPVLCKDQTYVGEIIALLSTYDYSTICRHIQIFFDFNYDSVDVESLSPSTESSPSQS